MPSIYAVVFHDPENRGFERVANDAARVLELDGFEPLYQSNEIPIHQEYVSDPDFSVDVSYGGGRLESLSAFDETQSAPAVENEEALAKVRLASRLLAWLHEKFSWEDGEDPDEAIATAELISRACDAWDEFQQSIHPEPEEGTDGE